MKIFGLGIFTTLFVFCVLWYTVALDDDRDYWPLGLILFIVTFLFGLGVGKNLL